ncbi:DUF1493 family protein [Caballeronia sp. LZ043]|uniref:DUF1493 family protein n=1 Tax=Caballeronia sp. LZ043 TaxID=3038569 RepID=UPI002862EF9C|nr:DUF1493 family protein [Caballeronia sp. LZ043]MDR5825505.1 DUF1493 family protein [Caballeronia sp. LZ043]
MVTDEQAWDALLTFVERAVGKPLFGEDHFTRDTDLNHDLDLNPDRISAFLTEWSAAFDIDMRAFDITHYYPASTLSLSRFLLTVFKAPFSRASRDTLGGCQLILGMLEAAMLYGKWPAS